MFWIELKSKIIHLLEQRDLAKPSIRLNALDKLEFIIKSQFPDFYKNPVSLLKIDREKFKEMLSRHKPNRKLNQAESSIVNNFYQILSSQTASLLPKAEKSFTGNVSPTDTSELVKTLMDEKNFKNASDIDNRIPNSPGLYCIRIKEITKLPKYFAEHLADRKHNIIYIGIASKSLNSRLNQELKAKGHGTFFRSIGAVLGFRPPKGLLITKKNKRNYKFSATDEEKIITWINENLTVNWIEHSYDIESIEGELITEYSPLINIDKNPFKLQMLSDLRAECILLANQGNK